MVTPTPAEFVLCIVRNTHIIQEKLNLSYFDKLKYFTGNGNPSRYNGDIMKYRGVLLNVN